MIKFYSTNHNSPEINIRDAILIGQAPDKGLYMPKSIPKLSDKELEQLRSLKYPEIAELVTYKLLEGVISKDKLHDLCIDAYNFEIPLEKVTDNKYLMRLDRGPTASFKDFAARLMARLMNYFLEQLNKKILILTATSGDTGGAVADAFYGQENVDVIVLYPKDEISDRQRKQMTTLGKNITAIGIEGKFDDAQSLVKNAFADPDLKELNLSSANSINFARLLPQAVYYFYAYSRLTKDNSEHVIFSVPSGNFGDLMGGILAYNMGLPVLKFIAAVNENDEFPIFLKTGEYHKIYPSRACLSNAMNVGHPSNLARLIDLYGGHLDEKGNLLKKPDMDKLRRDIASISISDTLTKTTIKEVYEKYNTILEPHGAVGWAGLQWYISNKLQEDLKNNNLTLNTADEGTGKSKKVHFKAQHDNMGNNIKRYIENPDEIVCISLETADPSKFPEIIREVINVDPPMPEIMAKAQLREEEIILLPNDYNKFKDFLIKRKSN